MDDWPLIWSVTTEYALSAVDGTLQIRIGIAASPRFVGRSRRGNFAGGVEIQYL